MFLHRERQSCGSGACRRRDRANHRAAGEAAQIGADCPWRYDTSEIGGTVSISRLLRDRGCRTDHPECAEHATLATLGGEDLIRPVVAEHDALRLGHRALDDRFVESNQFSVHFNRHLSAVPRRAPESRARKIQADPPYLLPPCRRPADPPSNAPHDYKNNNNDLVRRGGWAARQTHRRIPAPHRRYRPRHCP